jgi:ribosomal protein S18 acetylase RimI-like enzyme
MGLNVGDTSGIRISPMQTEDILAARSLWETSEGVGLDDSDAEDRIAEYLARNPGLCLVARDENSPEPEHCVGAVLCGHDGRRGYLTHLAVRSTHRGRGIGRRLVEECLVRLRDQRITRCSIHAYVANEEGQEFWRRLGFASRSNLTVMQRRLQD